MIRFIFGLPGTGKTTRIVEKIREDAKNCKKSLLIVPEQQTVEAERAMLATLPPSAQLTFEVLNFSRLANKLFRVFGGLSYNYITPGTKQLLMWRTLRELSDQLSEYGTRAATDTTLSSLMLSQIHEFKAYNVRPVALAEAIDRIPEEDPLHTKLKDLSLIYAAYEGMVKNAFDDNADDLGKLADLLTKNRFFDGYNVYIDGFTSFTAQEHRILRRLFSQADNVTVTFGIDDPATDALEFSSIKESAKSLLADAGAGAEIIRLDTPHRFASEELARINRSLWRFETTGKVLPSIPENHRGAVSVLRCSSPYEEAEAAANAVLSLLQQGYRYREIAVIARNAEVYRGILDSAFEKAGIPHFLSEKTDLPTKPLIAMLLAALNIKTRYWRMADVMAYVRSGIPNIPARDADVFENYVSIWNINGARFLEDVWVMNPEGYSADFSPRGEAMLNTANRVKEAVTAPLLTLFTRLDAAENVSEQCEAVRRFLEELHVADRMKEFAVRAMRRGDKKEAAEDAGTFRAVVGVLSEISSVMGEETLSVEDFATALRLVLNNTEIGSIPTAADQVVIGSAATLRASGIRCALLFGLCDGEFPARVSGHGFFSDNDRTLLSDLGISLAGNTRDNASEELLYCHRALTVASDRVLLFYHDADTAGKACYPSLALRRVCELLPHVTIRAYGENETDRLMSPELSFEALSILTDRSVRGTLVSVLGEDPAYADLLARRRLPVGNETAAVSPDTAHRVFGTNLRLTQSRIDKYVSCHFSYYCNYVLNLMEDGRRGFGFSDSGSFIHRILELFVKTATDENGFRTDITFDEIRRFVTRETEKYILEISPRGREISPRLKHLFNRLSRLAMAIALDLYHEFCDSDFVPSLFEMPIGGKDGIEAPPIELNDGTVVNLYGFVDRIDVFKKDDAVYVKVIDYKTGSKEFSFKDIKKGLNTQLLLYLFSVCGSKSRALRETLGVAEDTPLKPAGALYLSTAISPLSLKQKTEEDEAFLLASDAMSRSGIILDRDEVIDAVSREHKKHLLAGITVKGEEKKGGALISEERMSSLEEELRDTVRSIAAEMKSGNAGVCDSTDRNAPCRYCKMRAVCRVGACSEADDE